MKTTTRLMATAALALSVALGACDNGLTDINNNPNAPETVPPQYLLADAISDAVGGSYGTHGVWYGMYLSDLWSQQLSQPQYSQESNYQVRLSQVNGVWSFYYTGPLEDLRLVKQIANEKIANPPSAAGLLEYQNLLATAKIWTQYSFLQLTDSYGAVPYGQALQGDSGVIAPEYAPQQAIYDSMLTHLAEASQLITADAGLPFATGDVLYNGDAGKWQKFSNSLRMRMAMRISGVDPAKAETEFMAAYQAGPFASNADNAVLEWPGTRPAQNPIYEQFLARPLDDFAVAAAMVDTLKSLDDPRLALYADPTVASSDSAAPVYRGLPSGNEPADLGLAAKNFSHIGKYFRSATTPSYVMTYAEVLFLEAEAAEKGWAVTGTPESLWRQGVTAAMQMYGIPQAEIDTYLAGLTYKGLPSIYLQEWIALYMNGPEAWSLVRRTGYPMLTPAAFSGADEIPSRLPYPQDEQLYNKSNLEAVNGIDATLYDPLWWDVN